MCKKRKELAALLEGNVGKVNNNTANRDNFRYKYHNREGGRQKNSNVFFPQKLWSSGTIGLRNEAWDG